MLGFIYIWYDRFRKMFYIGCHVGNENDRYICSSNRMRDAFRRRPQDFKRRIIQRNIPKENILDEEFKWLSLIPTEELGKKYYNLRKFHYGHWTNLPEDQKLSIKEKQSLAKKGKPSPFKGIKRSDEVKKKISNSKKGRPSHLKGKKQSPEWIEKKRISRANFYKQREHDQQY